MKKLNIFAILCITLLFASCSDGLQRSVNTEESKISFSIELDGKKVSQRNARTIGISSTEKALDGFNFTASFICKDDSSKNFSQSGNITWLINYLQLQSLAKGSWTLQIQGSKSGKNVSISGSTNFTVGGREAFFAIQLKISGTEKGSIEFDTREEGFKGSLILIPFENYLNDPESTEGQIIYKETTTNQNERIFRLKENTIATIILDDIDPGVYYLKVMLGDSLLSSDIAYVYPGLTSVGYIRDGKSQLILDYGYVYEEIAGYQETKNSIEFEDGIAKLPGYGSSEDDEREPVRPGYIFTGWYDSKEAANIGLWPSVPLESKFVSQETYAGSNIYTIADRTLYAGWKKAAIPEELMNKNLFLRKYTGDGIFTIKGNFNNKFEYSGYSLTGVPQSYVVVGDLIYWLDNSEYIYFVDIEALEDNTETYYIQESHNHEIPIPAIEGEAENSNWAQALYYDGENTLYALCRTNRIDNVPSIWNLVKVSLPEQEGETPEANIIAIENEADRNNSPLLNKNGENSVFCKTNNFVVNEEKMYVAYTNDNETGLASFDINVSSTSFNSDGGDKELSDIYQPTKYGVDDREEYYGEDLLSNVTIQDMYVDNTGIYLLIRDTSITGNGSGQQDTLVSTGAIVALDFDLNVIKTYGKAKPKKYYYSDTEFVSSFSVAHSYDTSCFAEPYKLLAVYDRKLIFQERGIYCYFKDESEKNYYIKKFLNRVTVFDLDKECIAYTQLTDADIGDTGSLIDVSRYLGDHNFTLD